MKKLLLLSALLIFACSGDDSNDNNNNYNSIEDSLIAKWYLVRDEYYFSDGTLDTVDNVEDFEINGCRSYLDLKADFTLLFLRYFFDCSGIDGQTPGTWELINNSNTIRMIYNSVTVDYDIVTINNNNLVIETVYANGEANRIVYEKNP